MANPALTPYPPGAALVSFAVRAVSRTFGPHGGRLRLLGDGAWTGAYPRFAALGTVRVTGIRLGVSGINSTI